MIQRLLPVLIFAAAAVCVVQLINYSFTKVYTSIETSVQKPYSKAQTIYEASSNKY